MDSQTSILLVEDDPAQRLLLAAYLRQADYLVSEAGSIAQARSRLVDSTPNLVLLDLNLPDGDGLALARELLRLRLPVIVVTSRPEDKITALELGADDYLDKPYHPRELLARVHNALRRSRNPGAQTFRCGAFQLDSAGRRLLDAQGAEVSLTRGEFNLLAALVEAKGRIVSRADLAELISADGAGVGGRSVDVLVSRLRQKLETDPRNPSLLLTASGHGYRLGG
jgi:two-component system OmpR family response regulator